MSEKGENTTAKWWNNAVKAVRGESSTQLMEEFTSEMMLVIEGLYEDQARIRRDTEQVQHAQEQLSQSLSSDQEALETMLREQQRETDRSLDDMNRRLQALESRLNRKPARSGKWTLMQYLVLLAGIVCGSWVLVTVLNLFR